jgi:hypothetical protein
MVVGLIALVGFARLGMKAPSPAATGFSPRPSGAVSTPQATPQSTPGVVVVLQTPSELEFVYSPWPDRYADGIPRSIRQQDVYRLNAVLARAAAVEGKVQKALIGGWLLKGKTSGCSDRGYEPWCGEMQLADSPTAVASSVQVTDLSTEYAGPVVLSANVTAHCPGEEAWRLVSSCDFELRDDEVLWRGDNLTNAEPIHVISLLNAIDGITIFNPVPFHPKLGCLTLTPAQTYTVDFGEIQLVAVFPTTAARRAAEAALAAAKPAPSPSAGCSELPAVNGTTTWVTQDNVMVRVVDFAGHAAQRVRDLLRQLSEESKR